MRNPSEDKNGGDSAALVRDLRHGSWTAQVEEMLRRAADRIEELERQCARFELAACCPDERACEKASASSSCAARDAALEEAAARCDSFAKTAREMAHEALKAGELSRRSSADLQGLAAESCADFIRAMKGAPVPELGGAVDKSGEYDADLLDSGRDSMADDVLDILNVYRDQFNEDERIEKVRALCREQLVSAPHKDQPEGK